mmetsp:Transcript_13818/g.45435  ORF Transcript_13818/g.45435 Transcript_13818/m.45435 type:complete len:287 (+) Transcript_13818:367-1227(+)
MRPRRPPRVAGGTFHRTASDTTWLMVAVVTRRVCSAPAASAFSSTLRTRWRSVALVNTTSAHASAGSRCRKNSSYAKIVCPVLFSTKSHLFITRTSAHPSSIARSAILKSWSTAPTVASTTSTTQLARRIALKARSTEKNSDESFLLAACTFDRLRIPAVSMSTKRSPVGSSTRVSMASRVVPLKLLTMERSSPTMELSKELLPTLGRPTMATAMSGSSAAASSSTASFWSGKASRTWSKRSATPLPDMALTGKGSWPNSQNATACASPFVVDSHLLTARKKGLSG